MLKPLETIGGATFIYVCWWLVRIAIREELKRHFNP